MSALAAMEGYGYAVCAATRMMAAVKGSKGATGELVGSVLRGAFSGLNEIMQPRKVGMISVGKAQCKRTSQKADVWKIAEGG